VGDEYFTWFTYRQIIPPGPDRDAVTIVNWPMNDYMLDSVVDVPPGLAQQRLLDAKQLGLCLLYRLQTELGFTGLYLRPDITQTADGFAKTAYMRESRRIRSRHTVREEYVSSSANPEKHRASPIDQPVGIGAYRIDLHPSTGGDNYIDIGSLPFQIPLGALIPEAGGNVIPACKNIGSTHITNGCYRLHPVEWNIGEAAGLLAGFSLGRNVEPAQVQEDMVLFRDFRALLIDQGLELEWPDSVYPL
jgi:hypothetical protein